MTEYRIIERRSIEKDGILTYYVPQYRSERTRNIWNTANECFFSSNRFESIDAAKTALDKFKYRYEIESDYKVVFGVDDNGDTVETA